MFQNGSKFGERWTRAGDAPPEAAFITLTDEQKQALVGSYVSPQFSIKVFIDEQGRLTGQAPGQPPFELQVSTSRRGHVPEVGAQLDFAPAEGAATSVTLTQGGHTLVLQRQ